MSSDIPPRRVRYRHTQRAGLLLLVLGGAVAVTLIAGSAAIADGQPIVLGVVTFVLVVLATVLVLFSSLTVVVDDEHLRIAFGPGLIRYAWPLDRTVAWRPVRNPWWYGWGIHYTPKGGYTASRASRRSRSSSPMGVCAGSGQTTRSGS